jgi:hypothetical protein
LSVRFSERIFFSRDLAQGGELTAASEAFAAEARLTLFHAERASHGARAAKDSSEAHGISATRRLSSA